MNFICVTSEIYCERLFFRDFFPSLGLGVIGFNSDYLILNSSLLSFLFVALKQTWFSSVRIS